MGERIPVPDERRCSRTKADGSRCEVARVTGGELCMFHSPKVKPGENVVVPSDPLNALVHLDPTIPDNLQRLRIGLLQHVAAGTIEHQAATACLRFAQAAYDAQVKSIAGSSMSAKLRAQLLSRDDPPQEQPPV